MAIEASLFFFSSKFMLQINCKSVLLYKLPAIYQTDTTVIHTLHYQNNKALNVDLITI